MRWENTTVIDINQYNYNIEMGNCLFDSPYELLRSEKITKEASPKNADNKSTTTKSQASDGSQRNLLDTSKHASGSNTGAGSGSGAGKNVSSLSTTPEKIDRVIIVDTESSRKFSRHLSENVVVKNPQK